MKMRDEEKLKWLAIGMHYGMSSEGARQRYEKARKLLELNLHA